MRYACCESIVVAVANLLGSDGIVFVDDGNDRPVQEACQRAPGIEKPPPVLSVFRRQENLGGSYIALPKNFLVSVHELHLPCGSCGLQIFEARA